jgi:hypothetical protein
MRHERKTIDVTHTGRGGVIRVPKTAEHTAQYAAEILARREFGRRGEATSLRFDACASDESSYVYQAFIGAPSPGGGLDGHNVWIYV